MIKDNRRDFLKKASMLAITGLVSNGFIEKLAIANSDFESENVNKPTHVLPPLTYEYDALEPFIDKATMEIHHSKHHQAYIDKLNKAVEETKASDITLEELNKNISKHSLTMRNNAGGHYNHSLFWQLMKPNGGGNPIGKLSDAVNLSFGSFESFKNKFSEAAKNRFGSGWVWLVVNNDKKLEIGSTANQDNPLMDISDFKGTPVLALDVWEHAYYLKYQNKRNEYIGAWWNVINWEQAELNFSKTL